MKSEYKATTLVELLIVMVLTGVVMMAVYRSLDVVSVLSRNIIESDAAVQSVVDSLRSSDCYVQDSIYYAEQESLRIQDKINEIRDDE